MLHEQSGGGKIEGLKIMVIYILSFHIEYFYLFESFSRFLGMHDLSVTKKS